MLLGLSIGDANIASDEKWFEWLEAMSSCTAERTDGEAKHLEMLAWQFREILQCLAVDFGLVKRLPLGDMLKHMCERLPALCNLLWRFRDIVLCEDFTRLRDDMHTNMMSFLNLLLQRFQETLSFRAPAHILRCRCFGLPVAQARRNQCRSYDG
ncbi:hypothetical protein BC835DRAFT_1084921 [Cytidiella melzeri]|nr:hypothetical protein BC835DRAFT_1084921 [Cytidiella melzeri]